MEDHEGSIYQVQECERVALGLHQKFDEGRAEKGESFHNQYHIKAVVEAATSLVKAAIEGKDPLQLNRQLDLWNKDNSDHQINRLEEFLEVIQYAFLWHDLGNICQDVEVDNGQVKPIYHENNNYQAKDAEERSKEIAKKLASVFINDENKRTRFLPLILHLIEQTKFSSQPTELFNKFIQVVDQIGNVVFINPNMRLKQVCGLLNEMKKENPQFTYVPDIFFNFFYKRFPELVPDGPTREEIMKIWQSNSGTIPDKIEGLPRNKISID